MFVAEIERHLQEKLIPFWAGLADREYGGFYGWMGDDLEVDRYAPKGVILNSRILWFFSSAYRMFGNPELLRYAEHAYRFLKDACLDRAYGGVYWSVTYDRKAADETKHTYNQAFAVYALSSYYRAGGDVQARKLAYDLFGLMESSCRDEGGYGEAYDRAFMPVENEKLSENGVSAARTMNTLLHVMEAYTELYQIDKDPLVGEKLREILDVFLAHVYNPEKRRLEVFFDGNWQPLIDLHSYGHDIEASWLLDGTCRALGDPVYSEKLKPVIRSLAAECYQTAYRGHSLLNECENGIDNTDRIWWVQAESMVGFFNAWENEPEKTYYLDAVKDIWGYICGHLIDSRAGSEWYWRVDSLGNPVPGEPIVEPWKCPYHNGRMCMEIIERGKRYPKKLA